MTKPRIAIVTGSTRPGRNSDAVARWVLENARSRTDAEFELVDIADYNLPLLDEPMSAMSGTYTRPHTKVWSETIASYDGFVFVAPEYNHGPSAALKNAIDYLYHEWSNKAAGFVSYGGGAGGARAVEHLRGILAEVMVATVRGQVLLSLMTDFEHWRTFKPAPSREKELATMLDQLVPWSAALQTVRQAKAA